MSLIKIPLELVQEIAERLGAEELKALRLTHSKFKQTAEALLYGIVGLSKAKRDLDHFLNIANSPHLASLPTQLVWYDLLEKESIRLANFVEDCTDTEERNTYARLRSMVADAFWAVPGGMAAAARDITSAIQKMTRLRTFVAMPMPWDRTLAVRDGYYLQPNIFQQLSEVGGIMDIHNPPFNPIYTPPDDLFQSQNSWLPAALGQQFRALHLSGWFCRPDQFHLYADSPDLFAGLTTLDLCLPLLPSSREELAVMARCLQAAAGLHRLTLCFERIGTSAGQPHIRTLHARAVRGLLFAQQQPHWPSLQTLHLTDVRLPGQEALVQLVERHASTLRHLFLCECRPLGGKAVHGMAAIPGLKLESFQVRSEDDARSPSHQFNDIHLVQETALLAFVNKETSVSPVELADTCFRTGPFVWDPSTMPRLAFFDCISCTAALRNFGVFRPDWGADHNGIFQDDSEYEDNLLAWKEDDEEDYEDALSADDSWQEIMHKKRTHPYTVNERVSIKAWAARAKGESAALEDEVEDDNEMHETPEEAAASAAKAAAAKAADRRNARRSQRETTFWRWARVPRTGWKRLHDESRSGSRRYDGRVCFWKTKKPEGAHPTRSWWFYRQLADGRVQQAHGVDPLDFFSDWDSEAEGEVKTEGPEDNERPRRSIRMWSEPSVRSRAFLDFADNSDDEGDAMEDGVQVQYLVDDPDFENIAALYTERSSEEEEEEDGDEEDL